MGHLDGIASAITVLKISLTTRIVQVITQAIAQQ